MITSPQEARNKIRALREQASYLASPHRNSGPSVYEAEEAIKQLTTEADSLSEELYWHMAEIIREKP